MLHLLHMQWKTIRIISCSPRTFQTILYFKVFCRLLGHKNLFFHLKTHGKSLLIPIQIKLFEENCQITALESSCVCVFFLNNVDLYWKLT